VRAWVRVAIGIVVAYVVCVGGSELWARAVRFPRPCPADRAVVLVDTASRTLCLCRYGRADAVYRVAIGRGGTGKRFESDGKTPLGRYRLSQPRASMRFGVFIPVGYPTPEQQRVGYTGGAVGIHGPHLAFAWLRQATAVVNWTAGCIAVGTRSDANAVAGWVRRFEPTELIIS
jgi:murein L,D-transpeptidase YafK